jgi:hypothetical protein
MLDLLQLSGRQYCCKQEIHGSMQGKAELESNCADADAWYVLLMLVRNYWWPQCQKTKCIGTLSFSSWTRNAVAISSASDSAGLHTWNAVLSPLCLKMGVVRWIPSI